MSPQTQTNSVLSPELLDAVNRRYDQEKAADLDQSNPPVLPEPPLEQEPEAEHDEQHPLLSGVPGFINSIGSGIVEAGFQTADFFRGGEAPAEEDKSQFRRMHEAVSRELTEDSVVNSVTQGISQFTTGLVGIGKLAGPISAVQRLKNSGWAGRLAYEIGQGAIAGALVLDPHEERLSNLILEHTDLRHPVLEYLAADESDTAAEGRLKNALEGIVMDIALVGMFSAGVRGLKAMRRGDTKKAQEAFEEVQHLQTQRDTDQAAREAVEGVMDGPPSSTAPRPDAETPDVTPPGRGDIEITPARSEADAVPMTPRDQSYTPRVTVDETNVDTIVSGTRADVAATRRYGSREAAIQAGHVFARPRLPWQKLNSTEDVETLISRTAQTLRQQMDAAKGGDILSDQRVTEMVEEAAVLWGQDPEVLLGELAQAGARANTMVADMEAAYIVSRRMFEDAHEVSTKIQAGLLDEFGGSLEAAQAEMLRRFQAAADMLAAGQSMRAAAGRAVRRNRSEFAIRPEDIERFKDIPPKRLAEVLSQTGGDLRKLRQAAHPGFWRKAMDEAAFLLTNNLLWNYSTHIVNTSTNLYMLAARPTEKLIGSLLQGSRGEIGRRQAMQEYAYMAYSVGDAWDNLVQAFLRGDSIMAPHRTEHFQVGTRVDAPEISWKGINDVWDLFHNGLMAQNYRQMTEAAGTGAVAGYRTVVGFPTRALGAMDEFNKQLRYRAVIQARASVEGTDAGLTGNDLVRHVQKRLDESFTPDGRAIDDAAKHEAQITTFQQELLPGTLGKATQNFRSSYPLTHFVLPFVKTPINVLRYAHKTTPLLNLAQKEYRDSLIGKLGTEAQAHAMGQMAIGTAFMGVAAHLAFSGRITGSGPQDHTVRRQLEATGWQPYSIVIDGEDGEKSYFPLYRFDPVGMPFSMVADLVDMWFVNPDSRKASEGMVAVAVALSQAFTEKTYLMNLNQVIQALADPGADGGNLKRYFGGLAGNMIPGSSAIRVYANQDDHLREARTFLDHMMRSMPIYSESMPPRRDAFGDYVWRKRGLVTGGVEDQVDSEINRIINQTGYGIRPPTATHNGVDFRDVTLSDGENAYDVYQQLVAQPRGAPSLKDAVGRLIQSDGYQRLVDGDPQENGTKLGAIMDVVRRYREQGKRQLLSRYPELRQQLMQRQLDVTNRLHEQRNANSQRPGVEELLQSMGY